MSERTQILEGFGSNNTINDVEYYTLIRDTARYIYSVLADHCGPYASDALVIQENPSNMKDKHYAIFTKDGINIVRSIEFISPIQKHIQYLVEYIGLRVESLSHDGTTTSMMLFTKLLEYYFDKIITNEKTKNKAFRNNLKTEILKNIEDLKLILNENIITVEKLASDFDISYKEALRFVAHNQAMISSKGDVELAEAIVSIVESLPKELYGLFKFSQTGIETDKRFIVVTDDYNFVLPVLSNLDDMNHEMGTEYLAEVCDIVVSEDSLIPGNPALEVLVNKINDFYNDPDQTKDLVIIAKNVDGHLIAKTSQCNRTSKKKVIIFQMSIPNPYSSTITILSALLNTAGAYHFQDHVEDPTKNYLIKDAKVHFKHRRLYVSNLYQKNGSQYHPFFTNPDAFEPYTKMVSTIKAALDNFNSGNVRFETASDRARYEDYVEIYSRMICAEVKQLQIAGLTHDVLADKDVLQDSFGAVLSTLEHGFIIDGYLKFANAFKNFWHKKNHSLMRSYVHNKQHAFAGSFLDILAATHKTTDVNIFDILHVFEEEDVVYSFYPVDKSILQLAPRNKQLTENFYTITDSISSNVVINQKNIPILIQPADTYRELFKRLSDLLPKLIGSSRAIIPGTVHESKNT